MANKKLLIAVRELLNTVHKNIAEVSAEIKKQRQELDHDYICGHWTHLFEPMTVTVIKMHTGYQATVFRYGFIFDQLFILPDGDVLLVNGSDGEAQTHVFHDADRHTLMIGKYGKFDRDHEQLRHKLSGPPEEDVEIDFFPPQEEVKKPKTKGRKPKTTKKE